MGVSRLLQRGGIPEKSQGRLVQQRLLIQPGGVYSIECPTVVYKKMGQLHKLPVVIDMVMVCSCVPFLLLLIMGAR